MKYCQGPECHTYRTKDRIRGPKGDKHYETRKRSSMYYGNGNFCCQTCLYDWINKHIEHALDHFGRIHEPKRQDASGAWYKDYSGVVVAIMIITSSMIYSVNADQLHKNNTIIL